jgi:hypothetical protein
VPSWAVGRNRHTQGLGALGPWTGTWFVAYNVVRRDPARLGDPHPDDPAGALVEGDFEVSDERHVDQLVACQAEQGQKSEAAGREDGDEPGHCAHASVPTVGAGRVVGTSRWMGSSAGSGRMGAAAGGSEGIGAEGTGGQGSPRWPVAQKSHRIGGSAWRVGAGAAGTTTRGAGAGALEHATVRGASSTRTLAQRAAQRLPGRCSVVSVKSIIAFLSWGRGSR